MTSPARSTSDTGAKKLLRSLLGISASNSIASSLCPAELPLDIGLAQREYDRSAVRTVAYRIIGVDSVRKSLQFLGSILVVAAYRRFAGNRVQEVIEGMGLRIVLVEPEVLRYLRDYPPPHKKVDQSGNKGRI